MQAKLSTLLVAVGALVVGLGLMTPAVEHLAGVVFPCSFFEYPRLVGLVVVASVVTVVNVCFCVGNVFDCKCCHLWLRIAYKFVKGSDVSYVFFLCGFRAAFVAEKIVGSDACAGEVGVRVGADGLF